jgi:formamidopyrimidine-DNA glycosylase
VIAPAWGDAPDSWLFNHRWKAGGRCPREGCDEPLKRETIRGRTTCWCPRCQDLDSK